MMFARIVDGIVAEVINFDPTGRYPADWVWHECPPDTRQGAAWDGEGFTNPPEPDPVEPSPLEVTKQQLTAELERRLAVGFDYDFGDARGVHRIGTTVGDMDRWVREVTPASQAAINLGNPDEIISIRTDTGSADVTAMEWQEILVAAKAFRQPLFGAYFALKDVEPIPEDFADDGYWP